MSPEHTTLIGEEAARLLDRIAVTVKEAATLLGTNDKQIRKALYARELPAARLGNSYAIGVGDLRKWFDGKKRML